MPARPPKPRPILKWSVVGLSFLLLILWNSTAWFYFDLDAHNTVHSIRLEVARGAVLITHYQDARSAPTDWAFRARSGRLVGDPFDGWVWLPRVNPDFIPRNPNLSTILLPLWAPLVVAVAGAAYLHHRERRAARAANLCPRCNYSLAGLPAGADRKSVV